ncbi:hypothetical protein [Undibacterium sp. TC9W]|uniref:hypothetical protein n=1 Tax=Undibacterium sp. TC9W TaxID=3413053 RepID=UPI003BF4E857
MKSEVPAMRATTMAALQILAIAPLSLCDYANPALPWFAGHMYFTFAFTVTVH